MKLYRLRELLIPVILFLSIIDTRSQGLVSTDTIIALKSCRQGYLRSDSTFSFQSHKGYVPLLVHDLRDQATAPFHFTSRQWIAAGASVGITAALITFDGDIDNWAKDLKDKHRWISGTSPVITRLGGDWGIYSVAGFGLVSSFTGNRKGIETGVLATQAMITSGVVVRVIKLITGRERPMADYQYSKTESGKWSGPFAQYHQGHVIKKGSSSFDSFPSGHTATAFSIATVFASQYKDRKIVPVISYSLATLVGISRLTEHEHWASDVFVGGLLGYASGRQVISHFNKTHHTIMMPEMSKPGTEPYFTFFQADNQVGFSVRW